MQLNHLMLEFVKSSPPTLVADYTTCEPTFGLFGTPASNPPWKPTVNLRFVWKVDDVAEVANISLGSWKSEDVTDVLTVSSSWC
jgi:hypothetical protein